MATESRIRRRGACGISRDGEGFRRDRRPSYPTPPPASPAAHRSFPLACALAHHAATLARPPHALHRTMVRGIRSCKRAPTDKRSAKERVGKQV